ncbi:MAG: hypothetical protein H7Y04_04080 [Verrucomicrobia bacterium]|nr:hypothetical protein [Cytophagales bacterium]
MKRIFIGDGYASAETFIFILSLLTVVVISFFDNLDFTTNLYLFIFTLFLNLFILAGPYANYLIINDQELIIKNLWWLWVNDAYLIKDIVRIGIYERDTHPEIGTKRIKLETIKIKRRYSMNSLDKNDFAEITEILREKNVNILNQLD